MGGNVFGAVLCWLALLLLSMVTQVGQLATRLATERARR
jgi:hypothetical protein